MGGEMVTANNYWLAIMLVLDTWSVLPDVQKFPYEYGFFEMCAFLVLISKKIRILYRIFIIIYVLSLQSTFNCKENYFPWFYQSSNVLSLVHTCRQNPWLSTDKSPILSVDCCGTNLTWFRTFCSSSTPATCLRTIAELCLKTQVRDFIYKCVLSLVTGLSLYRKKPRLLYI